MNTHYGCASRRWIKQLTTHNPFKANKNERHKDDQKNNTCAEVWYKFQSKLDGILSQFLLYTSPRDQQVNYLLFLGIKHHDQPVQ